MYVYTYVPTLYVVENLMVNTYVSTYTVKIIIAQLSMYTVYIRYVQIAH